jgi:hypothetical protein
VKSKLATNMKFQDLAPSHTSEIDILRQETS